MKVLNKAQFYDGRRKFNKKHKAISQEKIKELKHQQDVFDAEHGYY